MSASDASSSASSWLDLSKAARYLGVHFTTLRRWADAGQVPCIRTPGGRRRFAMSELETFLDGLRQNQPAALTSSTALAPLDTRTLDAARQQLHAGAGFDTQWQRRFGEEQRLKFRYTGQQLLGLLIQFGSRADAGETFLEEGRRLAAEYGLTCCAAGMSISETVRTFLFFSHSMLGVVQQAGSISGGHDAEGLRLYQRMSDFLDAILLATVESYCRPAATPAMPATPTTPSLEA
jgi:excisionase family DNA binding protein